MIAFLGKIFAALMMLCYNLINNYGWSIVFFTFMTKIIMLPISIMVQFNSIKMVKMYPQMNRIKAKYYGSNDLISEENYKLYQETNYHPMMDLIPVIVQLILLMGVVEGLKAFQISDTIFLGLDLSVIPSKAGGMAIMIPLVAALSAWLMCFTQNISNVLQSEQSKANKYITMAISVGLSLYLGFFVQAGVGLYWIAGNIFAIIQMYILNACISPKKHIDYADLEESKEELAKVVKHSTAVKKQVSKEALAREKEDYRRFFKFGAMQVVFYSEKKGFYKYYKDVIEYILAKTDIIVHYISGDPEDDVFELASDNFRVYYIGENKFTVLMLKLNADICVMTTPDLQKYHIKRSVIRDDTEYIYMDHGMNSLNMVLRKGAVDYFDTIFVANSNVEKEIRAQEKIYGLKEKILVRYGYALVDNMAAAYEQEKHETNGKKTILIGPSWQGDNIMDSCLEEILDNVLGLGYEVIVRPHPQYVRHCPDRIADLEEKYGSREDFVLQTDFSSNSTVFNADIMMTDWSGIAYEYSFATLKPTLFINTPMKVMNPDYKDIDVVPFDIEIRDKIGISVETDKLKELPQVIERLLSDEYSREEMAKVREEYLFNFGTSAQVGAKYIIKRLIEFSKR